MKASLTSLESSLTGLDDASAFDLLMDSPSSVDVLQTGSPATGQYTIDVSTLASSQVLASGGYASASTVVGTGTLTFKIGTPTYVVGVAVRIADSPDETRRSQSLSILHKIQLVV